MELLQHLEHGEPTEQVPASTLSIQSILASASRTSALTATFHDCHIRTHFSRCFWNVTSISFNCWSNELLYPSPYPRPLMPHFVEGKNHRCDSIETNRVGTTVISIERGAEKRAFDCDVLVSFCSDLRLNGAPNWQAANQLNEPNFKKKIKCPFEKRSIRRNYATVPISGKPFFLHLEKLFRSAWNISSICFIEEHQLSKKPHFYYGRIRASYCFDNYNSLNRLGEVYALHYQF